MTRVCVLGSSSAGNATLVWRDGSALLVDSGFPRSWLLQRLAEAGVSPDHLAGVLLTHLHGDHLHPTMVGWLNERKIPLICAGPVADRLPGHIDLFGSEQFATVTRVGKEGRQFGRYVVQPFRVPHDSRGGCYGFRLEPAEGGRPVVVCTDLAEAGDHLVRHFAGAAVIVLESNHDPGLLQASARPMWLKRRIRERGHLSNEECAAFLVKVLREGGGAPPTIVLAHLSQECNTEEAALGVTRNALREAGFTGVRVLASHPFEPSDVVAG